MADPSKDNKDTKAKRVIPFASTVEDLKIKFNQITEAKKMGADLLFMITYMASLGLANATRPEIFTFAANRKEYISAIYIEKVDTFAKKWGFSYAESLSIVAERVNNTILKSMLNRYSNAIESGVPDEDFLNNELSTVRAVYRSQVEQGLEMLKKWGDAYIAMPPFRNRYSGGHDDLDCHLCPVRNSEHIKCRVWNHFRHFSGG